MGVYNSPNIFQENLSKLFDGSTMVCAYIDEVLVINKNNSKDHIKALDRVLQKPTEAGEKVNAEKYFSGQRET